jgi:hypothetical protein
MSGDAGTTGLRRCVLAVTVLDDVDLRPGDAGVTVEAVPDEAGAPLVLPWSEVAQAVAGLDPDSPAARHRLAAWIADRATLASLSGDDVAARARAVALPRGHALHPGPAWVRVRVPGDVLDVGLGLLGLRDDPERADVCDPALLGAAAVDPAPLWATALPHLERMGACAAPRLARGDTVLRPVGGCDVLTLLASATLRATLCAGDGHDLRAVCVPVRHRGWLDPRRVDPAFAAAAAMAADPPDRGFTRPVLVTYEEVVLARDGGHPVADLLADPAPSDAWWTRPVRYR